MDIKEKYRLMGLYDHNLSRLHHLIFVEMAGQWNAPAVIKILLARGEKPKDEGGWVPSHRNTMLKMVRRAQAIANEVERGQKK